MRKALLVIALVAASFAGGAAVNGPGLKWVKGLISSRLHPGDAIPTLDVDEGPPKVQDESNPEFPQPEDIPSAPAPLLGANLSKPVTSASRPAEPIPPKSPEVPPVGAEPAREDRPADVEPLPIEPKPADDSPPPPLTSPSDPPAMPRPKASGWADAPGPAPATAVLPKPKTDRGQTTDAAVAAATVPADPPVAPAATLPSPSPSPSPSPTSTDWAALRKRMRAMGVTKYWVEGTPAGAVTFRCVVPVPGQAAVNQQFEAEADDELSAADSALRRVAVWQATEKLKE